MLVVILPYLFFLLQKHFLLLSLTFPFFGVPRIRRFFFSISILHLKDLYRFYQTKLFLVVKKGYYCKVSYLNEWIHKQKIVKTGSKRFFYIVSLGCNISRPHIIQAYSWTSLYVDGTAIFDLPTWGGPFNPYNVTQTHSIFVKL